MEWKKLEIKTTSQGTELVTSILIDMGIYGTEIIDKSEMAAFFAQGSTQWDYIDDSLVGSPDTDASVIFYLGGDEDSHSLLKRVEEALTKLKQQRSELGPLSLNAITVDDNDWLHEWKKHFHPFNIGRVLIVPEWDKSNHESEIKFIIDPGSAFGTGQHATTKLCIEALQERLCKGATVLDIGCGSGILSIISLLLGAGSVSACDIDPTAVAITKKNAGLNPIKPSSLHVYAGDILTSSELNKTILHQGYDIVIANIVADVIKDLAPQINTYLKPGGLFLASGIITERLKEVLTALESSGLHIVETKELDGWHMVVAS